MINVPSPYADAKLAHQKAREELYVANGSGDLRLTREKREIYLRAEQALRETPQQ